jgi:hypothetical protein
MKLKLSLNGETNGNQTNLSRDWRAEEFQFSSEEEVKELLCKFAYSPHVFSEGKRKQENWEETPGCIIADRDDGKSIAEICELFKNYQFIIITSRNHLREKDGKPAVERFHLILPLARPIKDPESYKKLAAASVFEGFDPTVFECARYFYPSPEDCEVVFHDEGELFDPEKLEYKESSRRITPAPASKGSHSPADLERLRKYCPAMDKAFKSIEGDTNAGTPGHHKRIAVGNMIRNTVDDRDYLHELFSKVSDYDPAITDKHYDSLDHGPITCAKLQEYGICTAPCQLMKDIGKKSPVTFAYRKKESQVKLTRELLDGGQDN